MVSAGANLAEVVKALNALGATPADLMSILQSMKVAGALRPELETNRLWLMNSNTTSGIANSALASTDTGGRPTPIPSKGSRKPRSSSTRSSRR